MTGTPDQFLGPRPDSSREEIKELSYAGKTFFLSAAVRSEPMSTGFYFARHLHSLGAHVVLGTHSPQYIEAAQKLLGDQRVSFAAANLTNRKEVQEMADQLGQLNGVFSMHAGGMEEFTKELMEALQHRRNLPPEEIDEALNQQITEWVQASRATAMAINYEASVNLLDSLKDHMEPGSHYVFASSIAANGFGKIPSTALYYDAVAEAKNAFELHLEKEALELIKLGIYPAILIGNPILESLTGRLMNTFSVRRLRPEQKAILQAANIRMEDYFAGARMILDTNPASIPPENYPQKLYVIGRGQFSTEFPYGHPALKIQMPI